MPLIRCDQGFSAAGDDCLIVCGDVEPGSELTQLPAIQTERTNKQWEVIALEQLTHIEQTHNNREPRVAYDNSTWHAINTGDINSTKETSQKTEKKRKYTNYKIDQFPPPPHTHTHTQKRQGNKTSS